MMEDMTLVDRSNTKCRMRYGKLNETIRSQCIDPHLFNHNYKMQSLRES